jgi:hypothetical protein
VNMKPNPRLAGVAVALLSASRPDAVPNPELQRRLLAALHEAGVVNFFALNEARIDPGRSTDDEVAVHVPRTFGVHHRTLFVDRDGRTRWVELAPTTGSAS